MSHGYVVACALSSATTAGLLHFWVIAPLQARVARLEGR